MKLPFDTSYARLPERFFVQVKPADVPAPQLIKLNRALAVELGLDPDELAQVEGVDLLSGKAFPPEVAGIAMAYAGHQFGNFVPQLGDGRAVLLGEVIARDGGRRDIQLKGSGRTAFSRGGDGRAALGPVLREYIVSEAMAALGVPTTRSLAAALTGAPVMRERALPGAVLTRVAASHIRVGTFQYFAARADEPALRALADHAIWRHYPAAAEAAQPYRAFLEGVVAAQAQLIAQWMLIGFIHGVMNTDNMLICGETIDYGPCAFMDSYDPHTVFSSIDRNGRYAFNQQPAIGLWNLTRLAETILPLLSEDGAKAIEIAEEVLARYPETFRQAYDSGMRRKLGLLNDESDDPALANTLLQAMARSAADYTLTFRRLTDIASGAASDEAMRGVFSDASTFDAWALKWRERLSRNPAGSEVVRAQIMATANPVYIPRNHRIEAAIRAAEDRGDFSPFHELVEVLSAPFHDRPQYASYSNPPLEAERVAETFCGT